MKIHITLEVEVGEDEYHNYVGDLTETESAIEYVKDTIQDDGVGGQDWKLIDVKGVDNA